MADAGGHGRVPWRTCSTSPSAGARERLRASGVTGDGCPARALACGLDPRALRLGALRRRRPRGAAGLGALAAARPPPTHVPRLPFTVLMLAAVIGGALVLAGAACHRPAHAFCAAGLERGPRALARSRLADRRGRGGDGGPGRVGPPAHVPPRATVTTPPTRWGSRPGACSCWRASPPGRWRVTVAQRIELPRAALAASPARGRGQRDDGRDDGRDGGLVSQLPAGSPAAGSPPLCSAR